MKETITTDANGAPFSVVTMEDDGLTYSTTTLRPDSKITVIDPPIASGAYVSGDEPQDSFTIAISIADLSTILGSRIYKNGVDTGLVVENAIPAGANVRVTYSAGLPKWVDNFLLVYQIQQLYLFILHTSVRSLRRASIRIVIRKLLPYSRTRSILQST